MKLLAFCRSAAAIFRPSRVEKELEDELRSHIQERADDLERPGLPRAEALRRARLEFGALDKAKEECREALGAHSLHTLAQDVRFALRMLRKSPGFTAVAVLTLALGIGANTAIFSLINGIMFRTLPVRDPQQLVLLTWSARQNPKIHSAYSYPGCPVGPGIDGCSFSYPLFRQIHSEQQAFAGVFAFVGTGPMDISFQGSVSQADGQFVSGDFFSGMDIRAVVGRTLQPADDSPGAAPAIDLSYGYWKRQFGGDPSVVGKTIYLNRRALTVAGVAAPQFFGLDPASPANFWIPLALQPGFSPMENQMTDAGVYWLWIAARIKPGLSITQAQALADPFFIRGVTAGSDAIFKSDAAPHLQLAGAAQGIQSLRQQYSLSLLTLMIAVGIVLLIACANIAGLALARCATRQKEMAVRLALGAGRWRLIRQLLTESLLLAGAGGTLGIALAYGAANFVVSFFSVNTDTLLQINVLPDSRVLGFTIAISAVVGIMAGFAPALRGTRVDLTPALKENSSILPDSLAHRRWLNLGNSLVISQVALSVVVLAGAGMLVRTVVHAETMNLGFDERNLLIFSLDTTLLSLTSSQASDLYRSLQTQFTSLPGVVSATYAGDSPMDQSSGSASFVIAGAPAHQMSMSERMQVGPRFFETMRIPLVAGRAFAPLDFDLPSNGSPVPVIASETLVRKSFGGESPLGRQLSVPRAQIVGVAADVTYHSTTDKPQPVLYFPLLPGRAAFEIRTSANPKAIIPFVHRVVSRANGNLILMDVTTVTDQIEKTLYQERLTTWLLSLFALLALLLACIGLYGLLAYEVARRTREIGIRVALGARQPDLLRLVIGQGLLLAVAGAAVGIAATVGLTRYLAHQLYAFKPADPVTFVAVTILLLLVALVACYIPARRAMRVDPMVALRHE